MMHGRVIRPPAAGSVPVTVNEESISAITGARVVREGDYLAVVAEREWDAVRAAGQLQVGWSEVAPPFPAMDDLYEHIRRAPVVRESAGGGRGAGRTAGPGGSGSGAGPGGPDHPGGV